MTDRPEVSVIIPTRALTSRASLIHRALQSVLSQRDVRIVPIIVVNGPDRDPGLVRALQADSRSRVIDMEGLGIPGALQLGREAVDTEWFSALDDDDVFLPGALARRVEVLRQRDDCGTVVTNGLDRCADNEQLHIADMAMVERAPLHALSHGNWMLPGAWLCRSSMVDASLFHGMPNALECTYLAIRFTLHGGLCFLDEPTIAWSADTPGSASKTRAYVLAQEGALLQILKLPLPAETRRWVRDQLTRARHNVADLNLREHEFRESWRWHLRSLSGRSGWRYLPFTLRLARAALR